MHFPQLIPNSPFFQIDQNVQFDLGTLPTVEQPEVKEETAKTSDQAARLAQNSQPPPMPKEHRSCTQTLAKQCRELLNGIRDMTYLSSKEDALRVLRKKLQDASVLFSRVSTI